MYVSLAPIIICFSLVLGCDRSSEGARLGEEGYTHKEVHRNIGIVSS